MANTIGPLEVCVKDTLHCRKVVLEDPFYSDDPGVDVWWPKTWLFLDHHIAADCSGPPEMTVPVRNSDSWLGLEVYGCTRTNSITELVETWVHLFDCGAYGFNDDLTPKYIIDILSQEEYRWIY